MTTAHGSPLSRRAESRGALAALLAALAAVALSACPAPVCDGAACSAGDAAVTDAGLADAGAPDAGPADAGKNCSVMTDCPCFSNDDCPPSTTCHSLDSSGTQVFCVPGARGTGAAGTTCTGEADCQSALCVDVASGMACSRLCTSVADCPNPPFTKCLHLGFGIDRDICAR